MTATIAGIEKDIMIYNENVEKTRTIQETLAPSTDETASDSGKIKAVSASASFPPMTILGETYTEREPAAKALMEACKSIKGSKTPLDLGSYLGFSMTLAFNPNLLSATYTLTLKGSISYPVELGTDTFGNITRINNALRALPEQLDKSQNRLEALHNEVREAKELVKMPFEQETELTQKEARLARLNTELNIGDGGGVSAETGEQTQIPEVTYSDLSDTFRPAANMKARPSVLDGIQLYNADVRPPNTTGKDRPTAPEI